MSSLNDKAKICSTILVIFHFFQTCIYLKAPKWSSGQVKNIFFCVVYKGQTMLWQKIKGQLRDSTSRNFRKNKGQD